jgi:hypothetical protein
MRLILLLISFSVFAHTPSEESLLRNNQLEPYKKDTTVFSIRVNFKEELKPKLPEALEGAEIPQQELTKSAEKIVPTGTQEAVKEEEEELMADSSEIQYVNKDIRLKYIAKKDSTKLEQIVYNGFIARNNIVDYKEFGLILNDENTNFHQQLFYSVINILTRSDSTYFIQLMKKIGIPLNTNEELINLRRKEILEKYKDFLAITKDLTEEESIASDIKSPLIAESDEEQEEVDNELKKNWLQKSPNVNLIKKGPKLFWEIKSINFEALIENESRRVSYIKFRNGDSEYHITLSKYLLFAGQYDLPQLTLIKKDGEVVFEINLLKLINFDESIDNVYRRRSIYSEKIQKNEKLNGPFVKPSFII